jgi:hypothetical protein
MQEMCTGSTLFTPQTLLGKYRIECANPQQDQGSINQKTHLELFQSYIDHLPDALLYDQAQTGSCQE